MKKNKTPDTVEELFSEALLENNSVQCAVEDDMTDELITHLEESRKISIFSSEFISESDYQEE